MKTNWKMFGSVIVLSYIPIILYFIFYGLLRISYISALILAMYFILLYLVTKIFGKHTFFINELNKAIFTSKYSIKNREAKIKILAYIPNLLILGLFIYFFVIVNTQVFGNLMFTFIILLLFMVIYQEFIQFTKFDFENK
ncbi:hypothetical protein DY138_06065 [Apilactobacillus timberlakei]|uniref:hypothetical protein n=1 Tax=Apilactobacillus timberlakei TaxID=2008380 RepID=UPI0011266309|nr:hypothetical protein [Apilactobacillus timberlakei]TPR18045.1 hypothetical protein DY138_06065 [Apilactobacillus timberlakei]TPR19847.1 hypothetical protein DY061_05970 [Apilactobacillus timberlakei]TPR21385.1 hypothetical protein DY083_06465 [Apilactobacillus timberlakei]